MATIDIDNMSTKQSRMEWIDIYRGVGILAVILGHSGPSYALNKIIQGFHMPLFFLITGYLFKLNTELSMCDSKKKLLKRYIMPYFILCGINLIIVDAHALLTGGYNSEIGGLTLKYVGGIIYSRGSMVWMPNCSPLWFLTCVFCVNIIMNLIMKCKYPRLVIVVILASISAIFSALEMPKLPWNIDTAMMGVLFAYIGYVAKNRKWIEKFESVNKWLQFAIVVLSVVIGLILVYLNPIASVSFDNNRYGNSFMMIGGALLLNFPLMYICYYFSHFIINGELLSCFLMYMGNNTIFIMGFDYVCSSIALKLLQGYGIWQSMFLIKVCLLSAGIILWRTARFGYDYISAQSGHKPIC